MFRSSFPVSTFTGAQCHQKWHFFKFSTALRDSIHHVCCSNLYCKHHVELKKGLAIKSFASMQPFASYSSLQEPSGGPRGGLEDRNSGFQPRCVGHSETISSKKAAKIRFFFFAHFTTNHKPVSAQGVRPHSARADVTRPGPFRRPRLPT